MMTVEMRGIVLYESASKEVPVPVIRRNRPMEKQPELAVEDMIRRIFVEVFREKAEEEGLEIPEKDMAQLVDNAYEAHHGNIVGIIGAHVDTVLMYEADDDDDDAQGQG